MIGALAMSLLFDRYIKGMIGIIAISFMLDRIFQLRQRLHWQQLPGKHFARVCALVSGVTSTVAHAGGPPILVYLMAKNLAKQTFVATTAVFFTVLNAGKLLPYAAMGFFTLDSWKIAASLAVFAPLGVWLGLYVLKMIPERYFFSLATALLGISGIKLLYDALQF
ncbi:sulfite exporter TauE/SafE family protein [Undibacterium amnicola]|uniref:Probable membrane transporter protein n=1 Tax=Undibacterium amnicola TaxID=1834038 RepID=A0ABR6XR68_9BURK|nr:sulfite exporter TauE/SafE family protein [Undibacterium amnicola]